MTTRLRQWLTFDRLVSGDGTDYWGLFVQESVIDFDDDDDAAVMYEANKTTCLW